MPVVDAVPQMFRHFFQDLRRLVWIEAWGAASRRRGPLVYLLHLGGRRRRWRRRRLAEIFRVWSPLGVGHFDSNEAGERLLLPRAVDRREFGSQSHSRGWDRVPCHSSGAARCGFHGLEIIIVFSWRGTALCRLGITSRRGNARGSAITPSVPGRRAVTFRGRGLSAVPQAAACCAIPPVYGRLLSLVGLEAVRPGAAALVIPLCGSVRVVRSRFCRRRRAHEIGYFFFIS